MGLPQGIYAPTIKEYEDVLQNNFRIREVTGKRIFFLTKENSELRKRASQRSLIEVDAIMALTVTEYKLRCRMDNLMDKLHCVTEVSCLNSKYRLKPLNVFLQEVRHQATDRRLSKSDPALRRVTSLLNQIDEIKRSIEKCRKLIKSYSRK